MRLQIDNTTIELEYSPLIGSSSFVTHIFVPSVNFLHRDIVDSLQRDGFVVKDEPVLKDDRSEIRILDTPMLELIDALRTDGHVISEIVELNNA